MKFLGINGGPRKKWNTATLLTKALEGAASVGAETELVHLYDLDYKGCTSCFACKLKGGNSYGRCAMKDQLSAVLEKVADSDGLIMGSPIYFGSVTGQMRCFMERLMFQYLVYTSPPTSLFPRKLPTALIYTMNVSEKIMQDIGYPVMFGLAENAMRRTFGQAETFCCFETLQFEDYDKMVFSYLDPEQRRERRRTVFPEDCRRAYELGARMAAGC